MRAEIVLYGKYSAIHKWLKRNYGAPDHCEGINCNGKSKRYHWAKLQDVSYEHKRENFMMLCASCHKIYDARPETKLKIAYMVSKRTNPAICRNGHPRTEKDTYWAKRRIITAPVCRICQNESQQRYMMKRRKAHREALLKSEAGKL